MEAEEQPQQETEQESPQFIPARINTNPNTESLINKHLNSDDFITKLERMMLGFEYDDETEEWVESTIQVLNNDGTYSTFKEGPLMEKREVKMLISLLRSYMNPNVSLSYVDDDAIINDKMWDLSLILSKLFYRLRHKIGPSERDFMWKSIADSIHFATLRAKKKVTLDSLTQVQHVVETRHTGQTQNQQQEKFKLFG